jgi:peptidoglycan L-alanyl-D-glutamate endopeptidase CwlK
MPSFGTKSRERLDTCEERLQRVLERVVVGFDCTVLEGHRGQAAQDAAFASGASQKRWPDGNHNAVPSRAVDAAPWPVDWGEEGDAKRRQAAVRRFYLFAGYVLGVATELGVALRWGGDWDGDRDLADQTFNDLVHFELTD